MINNLISELNSYKTIAIFGYGVEGRAFENFAKKNLPNVDIIIVDKNINIQENYLDDLKKAELIVKSPGISLHNLNIKFEDYNFTSSTELFLKYFGSQIVGITGTKGKSTLATVTFDLLNKSSYDVKLCGNIGIPAFDIVNSVNSDTIIVMELSSHQLLNIKYSPHIAILTNLFEEHLDYYESKDEYFNAKLNIFKYQKKDDISIVGCKYLSKNITNYFYDVSNNTLEQNIEFDYKNGFIHKSTLQILEQLSKIFKIDNKVYKNTLENFKTLPHRLEYVDTVNDIDFINDSICTIPQAAIEAVKILSDVNTLILGGFNRGVEYEFLVKSLIDSKVKNIILYSQTGLIILKIFDKHNHKINIYFEENLEKCVDKAFEITKKNSICLFSPAAPSFDSYKNFEQRGDHFKQMVKNYNN